MAPDDQPHASTSALLLSTLDAYASLSKSLFASIEQPGKPLPAVTDDHAGRRWAPSSTAQILDALQDVDALLAQRLKLARRHAINQKRIDTLKRKAKQRDRSTRRAILALDSMGQELDDIVRLARDEVQAIDRAEKHPLRYDTLLAYAQRLSRYTSAPPGYKLPTLAASSGTDAAASSAGAGAKAEEAGQANADEAPALSLGPDYNPLATRAAAYYDPAMPSMPQEMPFPSDALMRQGILNSQEMLGGALAAVDPASAAAAAAAAGEGEEGAGIEGGDHEMEHEELLPTFSFQHKAEEDEEDDGFDLDLS
ncbi:related to conserved hypothetcial protein [Pseudozyma flocculosa]|uniref:Mediator of RNA polymerase II transcription subunit 4 n=1 Tax=Pseudozyma flocculosa TaxID=84751 RepID=A0A5C3EVI8_9BASI|nr:related to conserved hypothetcial protein [Pseudozyma flocculosa]